MFTVDVYRYKTIESIGNSFVTFPKGISYRFYQYYPINALHTSFFLVHLKVIPIESIGNSF